LTPMPMGVRREMLSNLSKFTDGIDVESISPQTQAPALQSIFLFHLLIVAMRTTIYICAI
ncbi:MAG: hypothetical protein AAFP93_01125, partial [Bacteroidota bacterium]